MGTSSLTPQEAFVASQPQQPWFAGRWSSSMFEWLTEITPHVSSRESLVGNISNLYLQTLGKPGREYRLGWLPHFNDIFRLCTDQVEEPTREEIRDWISTYSQSHLLRIAPYSAEEIKEEVDALWAGQITYQQSIDLGRLFSNPNADPQWLAEKWERYVALDLEDAIGQGNAMNIFDGIARNPCISDDLVREIVKYSTERQVMPLRHLLWNPALTVETFSELLPSRVRNSDYDTDNPRTLLWHGNVPTFQEPTSSHNSTLPSKESPRAPLSMGKDLEVANRETYDARREVSGWAAGCDNPSGYTRPDLIREQDLVGFLKSPWTTEVHMRQLDEVVYCEKYDGLRGDIAKAMISAYSMDPKKNSEFGSLSKSLNFIADHFRRLDELDEAMDAEVPREWLLEIL